MTKNNQTKMREQHLSGIMTNYTTSVPWLGAMLKNYTQLKMYLHCRSPISLGYGKQKCWNWRAGRPHQRQPRSVQWYKRRSKTNGLRKWIGQPCAGTTSVNLFTQTKTSQNGFSAEHSLMHHRIKTEPRAEDPVLHWPHQRIGIWL